MTRAYVCAVALASCALCLLNGPTENSPRPRTAYGAGPPAAVPEVVKRFYDGKAAEGVKELEKHLSDTPDDDQARFALGGLQLLRAFERCGTALHRHGLRTGDARSFLPHHLQEVVAEDPKPQKLTYDGLRKILQGFLDDLAAVDATLAKVKDEKVKLPLAVGLIKMDLFGRGKPLSASMVLAGLHEEAQKRAEKLVITFDRGDVCWLRGYVHFLCANCEVLLALDGKEVFESVGHRFFRSIETPYAFLLEEKRDFSGLFGLAGGGERPRQDGDKEKDGKEQPKKEQPKKDEPKKDAERADSHFPEIADLVAMVVQMANLRVKEPARLKKALEHLEAMVAQAKEMWKHILAEEDDDNEWIPNPKQKGALNVKVTKEMVDEWLDTLDEVEAILKGKKLLPFWRGEKGKRGVNLRKAFLEPPERLDLVRWVQGTAAAPYLEEGTVTGLADPKKLERLNRAFGSNFFGYAAWFN